MITLKRFRDEKSKLSNVVSFPLHGLDLATTILHSPHNPHQSELYSMIEKEVFFNRLGISVTYWIGQDAKDNFDILDQASSSDLWFHVYNEPSCHVIAHLPGQLDRDDLQCIRTRGAVICREHSKKSSSTKIMCAKVEDLTKGTRVGQVSVQKYRLL